jgi:hypothetical protein
MNPDVACGVGITGGSATITTGAGLSRQEQEQEAADLALVLRTGALPITLEAVDLPDRVAHPRCRSRCGPGSRPG